jgi:hypothetical protein
MPAGTVTAGLFVGSGAGLSNVSATNIAAANVLAGSLGPNVIASSVALNAVLDGSIVAVSASKLTGTVPAGSLGNAVLKTGDTIDSGTSSPTPLTLNAATGGFTAMRMQYGGAEQGRLEAQVGNMILAGTAANVRLNYWATGTGDHNFETKNLSRMIIDDLGRVGIGVGVADPAARLHVSSANAISTETVFLVSSGTTAGQELLAVKGDGKVGIGTTSPGGPIDVRDSSARQLLVAGGQSVLSGGSGGAGHLAGNLYWDGTNWNRFDTSKGGGIWQAGSDGSVAVFQATPGANPASLAISMKMLNTGDLGVGTVSPLARLHVSSANAVTTDRLLQVSSGTAAGQELLVVKGDGNVGIGTTAPSDKLTIVANTPSTAMTLAGDSPRATLESTASGRFTDILFKDRGVVWGQIVSLNADYAGTPFYSPGGLAFKSLGPGGLQLGAEDASAGIRLFTGGVGAANERMRITSAGNVGVGTTSPASKLHVLDGDIRVSTSAGQASRGIIFQDGTLQTTAASGGGGGGWTDDGAVVRLTTPGDNAVVQSTLTVQGNAFSVGGSTFVVSGGNVSVGGQLNIDQVNQAAVPTYARTGPSFINFKAISSEGFARYLDIVAGDVNVNSRMRFFTGDAGGLVEQMRIDSVGNVGIGSISPQGRLEVRPSAAHNYSLWVSSQDATGVMVVNKAGNVGIGTTSPLSQVQINKNIPTSVSVANASLYMRGADNGYGLAMGNLTGGYSWIQAMLNDAPSIPLLLNPSGGNVGIGTTSPSQKLDVAGTVIVKSDTSSGDALIVGNDSKLVDVDIANTLGVYGMPDGTQGHLKLGSAGPIISGVGGNVGIGTTGPGAKLDVTDTDGGLVVRLSTSATAASVGLVVDASNNVGIGTAAPTSKLQVLGTVNATAFTGDGSGLTGITGASGGVSNTGATAIASDSDASGAEPTTFAVSGAERMRITSTGNVGIGTASPTSKLQVDGPIRMGAGGYMIGEPTYGIRLNNSADSLNLIVASNDGTVYMPSNVGIGMGLTSPAARLHVSSSNATATDIILRVSSGILAGQELLVVKGDGKTGIGTTNPQNNLEIYGTTGVQLGLTDPAGTIAAATPALRFYSDVSGTKTEMYVVGDYTGGDESFAVFNRRNDALRLGTNNQERVTISGNGNVGVGTTSPAARLHISSANATVSDTILLISSGTAAGQELLTVKGDGKVGIGTTNPLSPLTVKQSDMSYGIATYAPSNDAYTRIRHDGTRGVIDTTYDAVTGYTDLWLNTSNAATPRMSIMAGGNVGIGTTSPASKLHVLDGDIRVSTSAGQPSKGIVFQDGSVQTTAAGSSQWTTNGTNISNTNAGNVGIGTTAPAARLDVQANSGAYEAAVFRNPAGVAVATVTASGVFAGTQQWAFTLYDPVGLATTDDIPSIIASRISSATIKEVWCESDDAAASINLEKYDGATASILASDLTCGTAGSSSASFTAAANAALNINNKINFLLQSIGGGAKRINVIIKYALN